MSEEIIYSTGTKHYSVRISGQFTIRAKSEDEARQIALDGVRSGDKNFCEVLHFDDFMLSPAVWERIEDREKREEKGDK